MLGGTGPTDIASQDTKHCMFLPFQKKPGSEILFFPALENYIKTLLPISTASGRIGLGDVGDSKEAAPQ